METESERKISSGSVGSRRDFLSKSSKLLAGAGVASFGNSRDNSERQRKGLHSRQKMILLRYLTAICILRQTREKSGNGIR